MKLTHLAPCRTKVCIYRFALNRMHFVDDIHSRMHSRFVYTPLATGVRDSLIVGATRFWRTVNAGRILSGAEECL